MALNSNNNTNGMDKEYREESDSIKNVAVKGLLKKCGGHSS
jgi:hypothetical protein